MRLWTRTTFWKRNIEKESKGKKKRKKTETDWYPHGLWKIVFNLCMFFRCIQRTSVNTRASANTFRKLCMLFCFCEYFVVFYFSSFCLDCFPPCSLFSCWRYIGEGYFSMSFQGQTASCLMDASLHRVSVEDPPSFIAPWTCEKLYHPT